MEVDFAFLSDSAQVVQGKLYVVGGAFDTIWTPKLPVKHPHLSFAMRLLFSPAELGRVHNLEINLIDEDGKSIAKVGGPLKVGGKSPNLPKGLKKSFLTVLDFWNLEFGSYGNYCFEIVVNNSSLKPVPLRIAQIVKVQS